MKKPIRNIILLGVIAFIGYRLYKKHNSQKEAGTEQTKNFEKAMQKVQMKPKVKLDLEGLDIQEYQNQQQTI